MMMFDFNMEDLQALWDDLHADDSARDHEHLQKRLEQRARQYAAPQHRQEAFVDENTYHVLVFLLGGERYAIDVSTVRGVRSLGRWTRVPGVPDFYRGVVNVRGRIVSILDLRLFLSIGADTSDLPKELLLAEAGALHLAILADHVEDVLTIPRESVTAVEMQYAHGVTEDRLIILDIAGLFSDDRLMIGGKTEL